MLLCILWNVEFDLQTGLQICNAVLHHHDDYMSFFIHFVATYYSYILMHIVIAVRITKDSLVGPQGVQDFLSLTLSVRRRSVACIRVLAVVIILPFILYTVSSVSTSLEFPLINNLL